MSKGLDVGTSFLITAKETNEGEIEYVNFRDAFFKIKPATPIAGKMIEKGLKGLKFFKDIDGSYVLVGVEAIEKAVERNDSAKRPLSKGVISPKEKDARRVLKFILKELLGPPSESNEKIVYSIPASPVDETEESFDVDYHCDVIGNDLKELGYNAQPI
ncbi:hypothetical protein GF373_17445, partial [bacterium]|nr:hypothetical protein [bacterium]